MLQAFFHYGLHFVVPIVLARSMDRSRWKPIYFIFLSTMLIDLDHLLAVPVFDPHRCSVGFHPLHSELAVMCYVIGLRLFWRKWWGRALMTGLLFHVLTDGIDCLWMWAEQSALCQHVS